MQKAIRRTLGVGGAAAVALAASLALAGVADAHTPTLTTSCLDSGKAVLNVHLQNYTKPQNNDSVQNTITISYTPDGGKAQSVLAVTTFKTSYPQTQFPVDGTTAGTFTVTITAWDDELPAHATEHSVAQVGPDSAWDGTWTKPTTVCPQTGGNTPPTKPTTTTQPPTTTDTPTSSAAPTTTAAAVAPVSNKTPPTAKPGLAYTGVSTELPLILGGVLIVLGAGALFAMRVLKRRRADS
jgi:hypothetical protein